ncbi:MAG: flagellar export protein FliJ [Balneolales bacterium]|nr:flagellar export protein FliJ [Balneolales bacterium]
MKFKFSLEPVLKVRQHQEKVQKQKLAEEVSKKNKITNLRNEVKGKLESYLNANEEKETGTVNDIKRHNTHLVNVHAHITKLEVQENKADQKVKKERDELAEAFKKLSILEKVKESEYSVFMKDSSRKDQKFMDEISSQSYTR